MQHYSCQAFLYLRSPDGAKRNPGIAPQDGPPRISLRSIRATRPRSIRRQRDLVVDQSIERCLHIDLGIDHAGLLQSEARGEDRLALRRADAAVGQLGALL